MPEDIVPGSYSDDGSTRATLEQIRAEALDHLRDATAFSLTYFDRDGNATHSGIVIEEEAGDSQVFLTYAAVRAIRDLATSIGKTNYIATRVVLDAIEAGIGA